MYPVGSIVQFGETQQEYKMGVQPKDTSRGHFYVSVAKSAVRIAAGFALVYQLFGVAGSLIIAAEILGIVEELV